MANRGPQIVRGLVLSAWLLWSYSLWPCAAHAGFAARILVVSSSKVPAPVRKAALSAIARRGELCSERDYARDAADQGLSPSSAEAIQRVATTQHARLIVLLGMQDHRLVVRFLDGRSAAPVDDVSVALQHRGLSAAAAGQVAEATGLALTILQGQEYAGGAQPTAAVQPNAVQTPQYEAAPPVQQQYAPPVQQQYAPPVQQQYAPPVQQQYAPPAAAEGEMEVPPSMEPSGSEESAPAPVESAEIPDRMMTAVGIGLGLGRRSVRIPTASGDRSLSAGNFPASDFSVSAEAPIGAHGVFGAHARYQSSIGLVAKQTPVADSATQSTALRSHHLELGLLPGYRFSRSPGSVSLLVFVGWGFRGLRPVIDISVPASTLSGLVLRPELRIPIADGLLSLRIAPELFGIMVVTTALRRAGNTNGSGLGLGGEIALDVRVVSAFHFALTFRESHVSLGTPWLNTMRDDERFVTLQGVLIF